MTTAEKGLTLIKHFEGRAGSLLPELLAYRDPKGIWTIGWGTIQYPDGTLVKKGDRCTVEQAEKWLHYDLTATEREVNKLLKVPVLQHEFDSLVAMAYNIGTGERGLGGSTLLRVINAGGKVFEDLFVRWNKITADHDGRDNDGDGVVDEPGEKQPLAGLTRRRKSEYHLYKTGELEFFINN